MSSNEKIAVAAHLHVLLRRKTGRVTDTEWMASNREYAAEIARFSRQKAAEDGHADLAVWAEKLEDVMAIAEPRQRQPLVKMVADAVRDRQHSPGPESVYPDRQSSRHINTEEDAYPESGFIESTFHDGDPNRERKPRDPSAPRYVKGLR